MKNTSLPIIVLLTACSSSPSMMTHDQPDAAPQARTGIEKCAAGGGTLHRIWSAANQHGEIVAMSAVDAQEVFVVTSTDGSVKQWTIGADVAASPVYGQPFD